AALGIGARRGFLGRVDARKGLEDQRGLGHRFAGRLDQAHVGRERIEGELELALLTVRELELTAIEGETLAWILELQAYFSDRDGAEVEAPVSSRDAQRAHILDVEVDFHAREAAARVCE